MQTSISWQESNNGINSKTYSSLEAEIVYEINQARFKNKEFIEEIISQIMENNDPSTKTINLKEINKVIHYYDESLLQSFYKYIEENIKTFQFLEEFTFLKEINRKFCDLFKDEIKKAKKIGLYPINKKNFHTLKTEIFSEAYYGYYIENITLKNIKLILLLIILEEFIILNRKSQMNSQDILPNIQIENDESIKIDTICFLTNNFSTLCINLDEIAKETNNNIKAYNIYLLLLSKDYFERNEDQDIEKIQSQSPMTTLPKKKFLHLQKKYDKIYIPNMQIPKKAIQKLILTMDSDNDFKVTLQDIILFSQKHYIYFEKEVYFFYIGF